MKKVVIGLLIGLCFFTLGCSRTKKENKEVRKTPFFVDLKPFEEFGTRAYLNKTGRLDSVQSIQVSSQVAGRVAYINKKEGDFVEKGEVIVVLEDILMNYSFAVEKALNNRKKAELNYETSKNLLDKQISDLEITLKNLAVDESDSKSALEVEKIENSLKKLTLDYENLVSSNQQTIKGFSKTAQQNYNTLKLFVTDVIDFTDKELGVTEKNKQYNDTYQNYIGVKDTNQKDITIQNLLDLISWHDVGTEDLDFTEITKILQILHSGYEQTNLVLSGLQKVFDNTVLSAEALSSNELAAKMNRINSFQATYNVNMATLVSFTNIVETFLDSYKRTEASFMKQKELLDSDKQIYTQSLDVNLQLQQDAIQQAKTNKELTLKNAQILINDADIAYRQALQQYNKLFIKAPISGVISKVSIDIGEELSPQRPVFSLSDHSRNEVLVGFTADEMEYVKVGSTVIMTVGAKSYTGSIYSLSRVADKNLHYKATIYFENDIDILGHIVSLKFPITVNHTLLPIDIVEVGGNNSGTVRILEDMNVQTRLVVLGQVYGNMIEVLDGDLKDTDNVIMNYMGNYDADIFDLQIK